MRCYFNHWYRDRLGTPAVYGVELSQYKMEFDLKGSKLLYVYSLATTAWWHDGDREQWKIDQFGTQGHNKIDKK